MSCRHDLANGTCRRCYPSTGTRDPGSEEDYEDNLEGIGAVTKEEYMNDQKVGTHYLKSHPIYFAMIEKDARPFDIRKNDRDFCVGDKVVLCEWDPALAVNRSAEGYTGRMISGKIVGMAPSGNCISGCADEAIVPGFVVLGMEWG